MSFDLDAALGAADLKRDLVSRIARETLAEDLQWGPDITTQATIRSGQPGVADVVARKPGTIAGIPVAAAVVEAADDHGATVEFSAAISDGDRVRPGDRVLTVEGPLSTLLTAERTLLNLLSQLSGVATLTAAWSDAIGDQSCKVRDTRKTVPGLRILQKYAVRCGGGVNHRMGLGDAALIKDNHVAAAGSVRAAYEAVRAVNPSISCEIECDTLDQVGEALEVGPDLILLDNMDTDQLRQAVALAAGRVKLEASGGLTLQDAAEVAATGVDYIAVGELTHSAPVLDLGFDLRSS
ncbi:nicotinate-nucleotide diphosphorylase (carboxylating) [Microlunatus endophyticus]|uniref:Nicotinate-nucleotide pyrophosphorylase [carboxylating] n=1 Tax=Microlunatus endophyticus TaxID=1716077 RepID=A0A917SGC4_9ACTN|nr:carboxylating nicotinate-nucleotide diphosphorylase [Microlunatus endophyticus]GGL79926.1 nicotinate-nucleotide diphosphorylase (carboxylating) [Microlunatus endophyticus]